MYSSIRISGRTISIAKSPYIIAEIGVNHDGSLARAMELVEAAKQAGADAVKLQYFKSEQLLSRSALLANYQKNAGAENAYDMLKSLEHSLEDIVTLSSHIKESGLHAIVTVFSSTLVEDAVKAGFHAYKVASPDIVNQPLIHSLKSTGKPIILSTGAATVEEISRAVNWLTGTPIALLQCVSSYPVTDMDTSLGGIRALMEMVDAPIGYSDHTTGTDTGALAVACGGCILEKHLTWDRSASGPDHSASLDPAQFKEYVKQARRAHAMVGSIDKRVLPAEEEVRKTSRQSIVTTRNLDAGHVIAASDVAIKRPGLGIEPWRLEEIIGSKLLRPIEADVPIADDDLLLAGGSNTTQPT